MAQDVITKALGLVSQFSPLSVQPGSLERANNVVNIRENVYEDRRGYKVDNTLSNNVKNVLAYSGKILAHNGTTISYGMGTYSSYSGSYSEVTGQIIRAQEASGNLYFTTSTGVQVFTDTAGTAARKSGAPRSLDPSYSLNAAGAGFLAVNFQCAYRLCLQRTDANKNVLTGYPSQRLWVINNAGTAKNIDLKAYLPAEVIAGDIVQFYRTTQQSGVSTDTAGDEMGLVYQYAVTATDIGNGFVTFTDSITDSLRGATLYTSPSQEGISQANERAPLCKDIALFRSSYMFYANTQTKQRLYFTLVGTSALTGNTFTIAGTTYNFGAAEITSGGGSPQVLVSATGVTAFDIDATARSLVRVINRYALNTSVYAYYLSGPTDLPGQIMIEEKGIGAAAFTILSSNTTIAPMIYPNPPVGTPTAISTSSNSIQLNALYYSKFQQFEHVPAANYVLVGPSSKAILRIVPLRESLIIIKEEGVYRLTGETPQSFTVTPLDLTAICRAPNSVAVLANQALMLSNQGVVSITETGISVVSHEIEPLLKPLLLKSNIADFTTAFGYESDRQYFLSSISDPTDSAANQTLVYNVATKTWVKWTFAIKSAVVDLTTDTMYFCKYSDPVVYVERKSYSGADYADPESAITVSAIVGQAVTFSVTGSAVPQVGWVISIAGTSLPIASIQTITGAYIATIADSIPSSWVTGAGTLYPSVGMDILWNPWTANQPASLKQARAVKFLMDSNANTNSMTLMSAVFTSNYDQAEDEIAMSQSSSNWGTGPWGSFAWGGGSDSYGYTTWVPRNKQYCTRLSIGIRHKKALEKLSICGVAIDFEVAGDRIGR